MFYLRYIGSLIYDAFVISALFFIATALCLALRQGTTIAPKTLWYQLILLAIFFGYYLLSYQRGGQTIGMRAWRLQVVSTDLKALSKRQILSRFVLALPAGIYALFRLQNPIQILNRWTKSDIIRI
ncbi:MAG: RDD family protein [Legionellales bacterium]|nr:RDD family protein [Legionellales bacterium]